MRNKFWVVSVIDKEGNHFRGIQKAMFGSPAIQFFVKRNGIDFQAGSAESLANFNKFLAQGLRKPLV